MFCISYVCTHILFYRFKWICILYPAVDWICFKGLKAEARKYSHQRHYQLSFCYLCHCHSYPNTRIRNILEMKRAFRTPLTEKIQHFWCCFRELGFSLVLLSFAVHLDLIENLSCFQRKEMLRCFLILFCFSFQFRFKYLISRFNLNISFQD